MTWLTDAELQRLIVAVERTRDHSALEYLRRLIAENRELRDQQANREFMAGLTDDGDG
jgi:hypothetical protein